MISLKTTTLLTLAVLSLAAVDRGAAFEINSLPYTITVPGVYTLERNLNLVGSALTLIAIKVSDVTLDLGGHTIAGTATQWAIHVENADNVHIKNGGVRNNLGSGILFDIGGTCSAEDLNVQAGNPTLNGGFNSKGIVAHGGGIIRRCVAGCVFGPAIDLVDATSGVIDHNIATVAIGSAIVTEGNRSVHFQVNSVTDNIAQSQAQYEIQLMGGDFTRDNIGSLYQPYPYQHPSTP
jgi:hypothetical protein